jgi:hypothetical protein
MEIERIFLLVGVWELGAWKNRRNWDDWSFMPAIVYDATLRSDMKLQESKAPYGSVVAALAALMWLPRM